MDSAELLEQRAALQSDKIQAATSKIKTAYGEKFDPLILFDSKRDISELLEEKTEVQSVREHLREKQVQTSLPYLEFLMFYFLKVSNSKLFHHQTRYSRRRGSYKYHGC